MFSGAASEQLQEANSLTLAALKKKKTRKGGPLSGREDGEVAGNEELKALEAHMLRLSKQGEGSEQTLLLHKPLYCISDK